MRKPLHNTLCIEDTSLIYRDTSSSLNSTEACTFCSSFQRVLYTDFDESWDLKMCKLYILFCRRSWLTRDTALTYFKKRENSTPNFDMCLICSFTQLYSTVVSCEICL